MHYIVIGLGNPHAEYAGTRHNYGADALRHIATKHGLSWSKGKNYYHTQWSVDQHIFDFVVPETYMNNSGQVFSYIPTKDREIVVVYDDLDIPFGQIKVSFDRSAGGHNGVSSLISALDTTEFVRIRAGIIPFLGGEFRKPKGEEEVEKHILGTWSGTEKEELEKIHNTTEDILLSLSRQGLAQTMTTYN